MRPEAVELGFNPDELRFLRKLNRPAKIQDFLETLPINFESKGETLMSPRRVLQERCAHCMEGALLAAAALAVAGHKPLLLDLVTVEKDYYHVVAPFQIAGFWGAISKTNHAVLRYREPIYKTIRELALSYFHEYFLDDGSKTLRSYAGPFNLSRFNKKHWATSEEDLWWLSDELDKVKHCQILSQKQKTGLRRADKIEITAGKLEEWKR